MKKPYLPCLINFAVVVAAAGSLAAAELSATITAVDGEKVQVEVHGDMLPEVGDPVEVYVLLPEVDTEAEVATGRVQSIDEQRIVVEITRRSSRILTDHLVRITSLRPRGRHSSPPPVDGNRGRSLAVTVEGWGTLDDPAGGATVVRRNGGVEMTVPGEYRDLWPDGAVNAPRLLRPLRGDFVVQVKITSPIDVTGKQLTPLRPAKAQFPYLAACLVVWHDEANFVRLERASSESRPHRWGHQAFVAGQRTFTHVGIARPEDGSWLRLARKQGVFKAWFLQEGDKQWKETAAQRLDLPDQVSVGVSLVNTINQPFTVRFEQFTVEN